MNIEFYIENCYQISKLITKRYSTSFSLATSLLEKDIRRAIYAIYGFVRLADEIVDSFQGYDKASLLNKLNEDLNYALENGISTNTVLAAFSDAVKKFNINIEYINAFMKSMEYDLTKSEYTNIDELDEYIYGSADVVGLMCLKVFCNGHNGLFEQLKHPAQKLGSAFQKVNFIRDLKDDINGLGRSYFPDISNTQFDRQSKKLIEHSIEIDFDEALDGIKHLPGRSRLAVAIAYYYYKDLFQKIKKQHPKEYLRKELEYPMQKNTSLLLKQYLCIN